MYLWVQYLGLCFHCFTCQFLIFCFLFLVMKKQIEFKNKKKNNKKTTLLNRARQSHRRPARILAETNLLLIRHTM